MLLSNCARCTAAFSNYRFTRGALIRKRHISRASKTVFSAEHCGAVADQENTGADEVDAETTSNETNICARLARALNLEKFQLLGA